MMRGTITVHKDDIQFLKDLGVRLIEELPSDDDDREFECAMTDEVFENLNWHWGRFIWSLVEDESN